ncbi:MAG: substrate-binding domain-containing protein, partial [Acidimicrobiales bacterium]
MSLVLRIAATLGLAAVAAVCIPAARSSASTSKGAVTVLYAGSLVDAMNDTIAPSFLEHSGYTISGFPGGSLGLANQIKGGVVRADVFISASPRVNSTLEGRSNGGWASWYATFATSPLVLGYNPSSRFARELRDKPWYEVVTQNGFRLGRTDPATDPKGILAVSALRRAQSEHSLGALGALATSQSDVFDEAGLVGRLQSGQLDAGFLYAVEARSAGIPTVSLGHGLSYEAVYTITVLN